MSDQAGAPEWIPLDGVLIIGAGVAGLFAALKLAPIPCTVLSPEALGEGASSAWAQGGVAAAMGPGDSPEAHAADTIRAGAGLVDPEIAELAAREAPERVADLARLGAPFARAPDGALVLAREAAHSAARVVRFAEGDGAGRAIMTTLQQAVAQTPSIRIVEGVLAEEILIGQGRAIGALCRRIKGGAPAAMTARAVLLAAGGLAGLYSVTTNPTRIRGQAVGMAARAGAAIRDAEFVQFHPTAIAVAGDPTPLATEALRGEGAVLIDKTGQRFMVDVHPDAELAPRDVVARAVFRQIARGDGAYLDAREAVGAAIDQEFPAVAAACRAAGIDPAAEPIPVAPAAHYHMGGVATDAAARTGLPGLWAAGEAAATGLHGANRLASNGLLEGLVFGARAAADISEALDAAPPPRGGAEPRAPLGSAEPKAIAALRETMSALCGVERDAGGLSEALRRIAAIETEAATGSLLNMTAAATISVAAALRREESRGGHFRTDYPQARPELATSRLMFLDDARALRSGL